jgi:ribosomal protein S2
MVSIDRLAKDAAWDNLSKREKLQITRQHAKLEKMLEVFPTFQDCPLHCLLLML